METAKLVLVSLFWLGLLSCSIRQINTKSSQYTMEMEDFDNYTYFYDNYEEDEQFQSHLSVSHMVSLSLCSVAFLLGVPGNAIVIWFMGFKWNKSVSTLWFLNLAIADFIFVLFLPFYIIYVALGFHWPFGKLLCKVNSFIALLNMFASVFFLTFISLDRYIRLVHPTFSCKYWTLRNALILSGIIWLLAAIIGGPALYFRDTTIHNNNTICYNNFHLHDKELIVMRHHVLIWVRFVCGYLFPLVTMVLCYSLLIVKVKRRTLLTSSRLFWTMVAVVVAFFVCWTPYHIFSILELSAHHSEHLHGLLQDAIPLSTGLAFINSCLNPILYVLISKKFQVHVRATVSEALKLALWEVSRSGTVSEQLRSSENTHVAVNYSETRQ
ncbi:G-protein coupled receptor 1 isoform X2 [Alligator sinensis]|uniref:Chemerin-like receptor 2 n=1 Tax=Alligator sinensis TaxID=38654 RepID=A0A3Q0H8T8_ALLSI|nr:G-protein coupled receptor 1 isoform X2 [Alligator sinensis]